MTGKHHSQLHEQSDDSLRAAVCHHIHHWDNVIKCTKNDSVLFKIGHRLTYEKGKGVFSVKCPYFQLEGHKVSDSNPDCIKLPNNISELNDYMCGPMTEPRFFHGHAYFFQCMGTITS